MAVWVQCDVCRRLVPGQWSLLQDGGRILAEGSALRRRACRCGWGRRWITDPGCGRKLRADLCPECLAAADRVSRESHR